MFITILFYVLAFVLVVAAFRVITASSPVTAVLHLILAFANAAMIWMLLGAEFLGLLLVLVYVGAVMVFDVVATLGDAVRGTLGSAAFGVEGIAIATLGGVVLYPFVAAVKGLL